MDLYAENILEHYRHPRRKRPVENPTVERRETNASCGDDCTICLRLRNDVLEDIGWQGSGCAISQASMSLLADELAGKTLDAVGRIDAARVLALLGVDVGPARLKCALLGLLAVHNALRDHRGEAPIGWRPLLEPITS